MDYNQQQQQQGQQPFGMSSQALQTERSFMDDEKQEIIKWMLDPADIIAELEHTLRNERYDDKKEKWYKPKGTISLMNDHGINSIMALVSSRLGKVIKLSYLSEEDVMSLGLEFENDLIFIMCVNYKKWGMDAHYIPSIRSLFGTAVLASLKSAEKGRTLSFLKTNTRTMETYHNNSAPSKSAGGILGKFLR